MEAGWILHRRPYRESSSLVDVLTADGRRRGVVRGSAKSATAAPFSPLMIDWGRAGDLTPIKNLEPIGPSVNLQGQRLYCGFYVNELCVRLLPSDQPCPSFLVKYGSTLALLLDQPIEPVLRRFELTLLDELGFGFPLDQTSDGQPIAADLRYWVHPETGTRLAPSGSADSFLGRDLIAAQADQWSDPETLKVLKRLNRRRLEALLGDKPLQSRNLLLGARQ